jgi:hypothetical protein
MEESATIWLGHAINIGEALLLARKQVAPDKWLHWMEANLEDFTPAQAEVYMRVARDKDAFRSDSTSRDEAMIAFHSLAD